ncbi:hypothetical protein Pla52o_54060 [Novipirellula galeiformis]|uniref:Uncharacterized protein n=1 Tax=Novipirellula galeiformis TaxID=2528004 RepID=A0A5C6C0R9_9BACT|nr:hypothetical protein Pla52o_54060 [Novipirellula galeiformis]
MAIDIIKRRCAIPPLPAAATPCNKPTLTNIRAEASEEGGVGKVWWEAPFVHCCIDLAWQCGIGALFNHPNSVLATCQATSKGGNHAMNAFSRHLHWRFNGPPRACFIDRRLHARPAFYAVASQGTSPFHRRSHCNLPNWDAVQSTILAIGQESSPARCPSLQHWPRAQRA